MEYCSREEDTVDLTGGIIVKSAHNSVSTTPPSPTDIHENYTSKFTGSPGTQEHLLATWSVREQDRSLGGEAALVGERGL